MELKRFPIFPVRKELLNRIRLSTRDYAYNPDLIAANFRVDYLYDFYVRQNTVVDFGQQFYVRQFLIHHIKGKTLTVSVQL